MEWCGMARAVPSAVGNEQCLLVPQPMFASLHLDPNQPVLVTNPADSEGVFASLLPRPHAEAVLGLPGWACSRLGLDQAEVPTCIVHRPLGAQACAEARRLLQGDPGPGKEVSQADGWADAADRGGMMRGLMNAALLGNRVVLRSPRGQLVGGPGKVTLAEDADLPRREEKVVEVATPAE